MTNTKTEVLEVHVGDKVNVGDMTFRGAKFFDFYVETMISKAAEDLEIGQTYTYEEIDDDGDTYEEEDTIDGQECYLGYSPSEDKFYMGFDMFGDCDGGSAIVKLDVKLNSPVSHFIASTEVVANSGKSFYTGPYSSIYDARSSGAKMPHGLPADLVDLRLD